MQEIAQAKEPATKEIPPQNVEKEPSLPNHPKLKQIFATAICGNDISSSFLYVAAIAAMYSGIFAPLILLTIGIVLYFYKKVYHEVVETLPLNGGCYNALLNSTRKLYASVAACLTILSYVATAVISANTAAAAADYFLPGSEMVITIVILFVFACLTSFGIGESAKVALGIFAFHLGLSFVFIVLGLIHVANQGPDILIQNYTDTINFTAPIKAENLFAIVIFGFSASLLGVSGFESSANFREQQAPGVFPKTLRNMLLVVIFFNPMISIVSLSIVPIESIVHFKKQLLIYCTSIVGGEFFSFLMIINSISVLSGAVLTAFIGVSGLVQRMSVDEVFPVFFANRNRKGMPSRIIWTFFFLCTSILLVTGGELSALAGVYTISFLSVMCLFALAALMLKLKRPYLKRPYSTSRIVPAVAFLMTFVGIVGNVFMDGKNVLFFMAYFIPTVLVVLAMFWRVKFLSLLLKFLSRMYQKVFIWAEVTIDRISKISHQAIIVFLKEDDAQIIHRILGYIRNNELGRKITFVNLKCEPDLSKGIEKHLDFFRELYPDMTIKFKTYQNLVFGPPAIDILAEELGVPKNRMFIGSPSTKVSYTVQELGEVRIIF